jgi:hypothetical protein
MQTKILRRGTTPEAYRIYRAGLEWDLTDPIVIEKREDIKSELRWRDRVEPYNHQVTNYAGPRAPTLPVVVRSMALRDFTLAAFKCLGALITSEPPYRYLLEDKGKREHIHFDENIGGMEKSTLYAPGAPAFLRLVSRIITTGICAVEDMDRNPVSETEKHVRQWVHGFSGKIRSMDTEQMHRCFKGTAIIRAHLTS